MNLDKARRRRAARLRWSLVIGCCKVDVILDIDAPAGKRPNALRHHILWLTRKTATKSSDPSVSALFARPPWRAWGFLKTAARTGFFTPDLSTRFSTAPGVGNTRFCGLFHRSPPAAPLGRLGDDRHRRDTGQRAATRVGPIPNGQTGCGMNNLFQKPRVPARSARGAVTDTHKI